MSSYSYQIRASARAKHVSIKISPYGQIEVVVPRQFDTRRLPEILEKKQTWIEQTLARLAAQRQSADAALAETRPSQIQLRSLDEIWDIVYQPSQSERLQVKTLSSQRLAVTGPVAETAICQEALRRWLQRKAQQILPRWLQRRSRMAGLPYRQVAIRGQKTRWGSCSSQQHISLNYKLLFLPPSLVDYVLVHELCHTRQMNHSPAFWSLVAQQMADYQQHKTQLKQAWQYIPRWVEQ
ncbi:SprT family zinc-dependent metalloprotease [Sphaerothrix gracilis]|uniref:M48 family metallopeptidase n=1 Tax=Sphaerothrix gracilis TaxID=3151835 RepID=UPI0031FD077F